MITQQQTFTLENMQDLFAQEDFGSFLRFVEDDTQLQLQGLGANNALSKEDLSERLRAVQEMRKALEYFHQFGLKDMPPMPPQMFWKMQELYNKFKELHPMDAQYLINNTANPADIAEANYRYLPDAPAPAGLAPQLQPEPQVQQPPQLTPQQQAKRRMKLLEKLGLVPTLDPKVDGQN